ncbi:oxidoreductase, partial [Pseudomonas aeruginosa]|nr:oxidoreductase [Pseudomonas aeruginosa]
MNNLIRLRDGVAEVCRDDPWQLLRELPDALPPGPLLLPLAAWLEHRGEAGA